MDQGTIVDIAQKSLLTIISVSAPMLLLSLIVGLAVSIFQATTQIQESTLTFIPKILAVFAAILLFGLWMLRTLSEFTLDIYGNINLYIR
ncbi:MAG TPA: flagellar biosynthesis protein FliQ [Clostridiaceae bacterium]|nr:flagellar biosynthesis protein FliQ [Clostridiaceae bacterium]